MSKANPPLSSIFFFRTAESMHVMFVFPLQDEQRGQRIKDVGRQLCHILLIQNPASYIEWNTLHSVIEGLIHQASGFKK